MDLLTRTLFLCLAFALTRAGPLPDAAAAPGDGKPPKCSDVKLGAMTADDAGTTYIFADITGRHCEHHRNRVQARGLLIGAFLPECDDNGLYQPQQCHGSTGYCWCADSMGREKPGTATPPGVPNVDCSKPAPDNPEVVEKPEASRTKCQRHRDGKKTTTANGHPIAGVFVPKCDENGEYVPQQCHASTGHCWCVDSTGVEMLGTKTPPGSLTVDCNHAAARHCERHRTRVEATGTLIGAFLPKCDDDGQYLPQQCHGSTGHCWCVDNKGREKPGTRTPPGAPSVDCSTADGPQRHCDRHRVSIQAKGLSIGAFLPKCDENGQYQPQQCHGSTGHCWCVDKMGQERPGTRTPPGTQSMDCEKASRVYMRLDTIRDGLHSLPVTRAWQEVGDRVDAAFSYTDKMYLIKGNDVYVYLVRSNFTLIGNRPQSLKFDLGIEGPVDAAFVCPDEHVAHIIQGNRMRDIDLSATARTVIRDRPLPLSDIDAALCGPDGIKLFKGSEYYHYESPMILAMGRIAPEPKKITSAVLDCED